MSKPKHPRGLEDSEAQAVTWNIRVSPRKLNLAAGLIRGKKAQDAVAILTLLEAPVRPITATDAFTFASGCCCFHWHTVQSRRFNLCSGFLGRCLGWLFGCTCRLFDRSHMLPLFAMRM